MFNLRTGSALGVLVLLFIFYTGCGQNQQDKVESTVNDEADRAAIIELTLAHFWSEPSQKQELERLAQEYAAQKQNITINLLDLNWSDGKTKLQLAFNSGTPPDIIHLGLEWTPEFARAGVLQVLPETMAASTADFLPQALKALTHGKAGQQYALPWFVNTRSMVINKNLAPAESLKQVVDGDTLDWDWLDQILQSNTAPGNVSFGVNATEPHNVLKKALPIIWSAGSDLFASAPLHSSFDPAAITGLERYCTLAGSGQIEASRTLDDMFVNGQLAVWLSGAWLETMLDRGLALDDVLVLGSIPGAAGAEAGGWSILGGDALAVSSRSQHPRAAWEAVHFLSSYAAAKSFSQTVPDAGLPAHRQALEDSDFRSNSFKAGFVKQISRARPLPSSPFFVEAQAVLEHAIMEAVYGRLSPAEALAGARAKIRELESLQQ